MDVEKLVRMANQIAANLDCGPDKEKVAAAAADHLKRFWNSTMRAAVIEGHSKNLLDLSPVAARAIDMPEWPAEGSVALVDGVIVVKLGRYTPTQRNAICAGKPAADAVCERLQSLR